MPITSHRHWTLLGFVCATLGLCTLALAGEPTDLQGILGDDVAATWIYDDIDAGYAAAQESGKPLLIVFR